MAKNIKTVGAKLDVQSLKTIFSDLAIPDNRWDLCLISDGSGNEASTFCGWSGVLISRLPEFRKLFFGYRNTGGVTYAELHPCVQALQWHWLEHGRRLLRDRLKLDPLASIVVHILCDNATTVNQGNGQFSRECERFQWATIDEFVRCGYKLHWHWRPRNYAQLNRLCDAIAGQARELALQTQADLVEQQAMNRIYTLNPLRAPDAEASSS